MCQGHCGKLTWQHPGSAADLAHLCCEGKHTTGAWTGWGVEVYWCGAETSNLEFHCHGTEKQLSRDATYLLLCKPFVVIRKLFPSAPLPWTKQSRLTYDRRRDWFLQLWQKHNQPCEIRCVSLARSRLLHVRQLTTFGCIAKGEDPIKNMVTQAGMRSVHLENICCLKAEICDTGVLKGEKNPAYIY